MHWIGKMHPMWQSVRENRDLEWALALATISLGMWLALPMTAFSPLFARAAEWRNEEWWGVGLVLAGSAHYAALWINGAKPWTPKLRVALLLGLSLPIYGLLTVAVATVDPRSFGMATLVLLTTLTLYCIRRASADAHLSKAKRDAGIPV